MKRVVASGVLAGGVVLAGGFGVAYSQTPTTTAAGTEIAGTPLAGLQEQALARRVQALVDGQPAMLTVQVGARTVKLDRNGLGASVDVTATAEHALDTSGRRSVLGLVTLGGGQEVLPQLAIDDGKLAATVAKIVKAAQVTSYDGDLTFAGGRFSTKPPTAGQSTTADQVRTALLAAVEQLEPTATVPVTTQAPATTAAALTALATQAGSAVQPVTIKAADLTATVPLAQLGPLVTVKQGSPLTLALRPAPTQALAATVATRLTRSVQQPRFATPPSAVLLSAKGNATWSPRPAAVTVTAPGRDGLSVPPAAIVAALTTAVQTGQPAVTLPPVVKPAITAASAAAVKNVIGSFTTAYACCQNRVKNIQLIARTVDGTVIAPGETFSLNGIVGRRTKAKGYVEAPFILDGKLDMDIGGGVSQFATTTYNAAFFAGVQLNSHKAHSFYISRYPPGREATVNFPGIDLRWTNNTSAPIVVDTSTTATSLTVTLYGDNGGRTVSALTGERRPAPGRDFRITVTRTITRPGAAVVTERTTTLYAKPPEDH